jgi:hypothetical protein
MYCTTECEGRHLVSTFLPHSEPKKKKKKKKTRKKERKKGVGLFHPSTTTTSGPTNSTTPQGDILSAI